MRASCSGPFQSPRTIGNRVSVLPAYARSPSMAYRDDLGYCLVRNGGTDPPTPSMVWAPRISGRENRFEPLRNAPPLSEERLVRPLPFLRRQARRSRHTTALSARTPGRSNGAPVGGGPRVSLLRVVRRIDTNGREWVVPVHLRDRVGPLPRHSGSCPRQRGEATRREGLPALSHRSPAKDRAGVTKVGVGERFCWIGGSCRSILHRGLVPYRIKTDPSVPARRRVTDRVPPAHGTRQVIFAPAPPAMMMWISLGVRAIGQSVPDSAAGTPAPDPVPTRPLR